ncbi:MAG: hypothetical protein KDJ65_21820 [Anaerolineae bacterium]|nr:hypothetical protein [Anaerolineae bacterium]
MSIKETFCPECDHRLKLGSRPHKGQRVNCPSCASTLVVESLNPIELTSSSNQYGSSKSKKKSPAVETSCPECDAPIKLGARVQMGQLLKCSECDVTLEVIDTNPLELDVALMGNIKFRHQNGY